MSRLSVKSLVFFWISATACVAKTYDSPQQLSGQAFDFIVIGGGTAGNVIANRLTENPSFEVLVIEAGPDNEGVFNSIVPALTNTLAGTQYDWNFTTTPQQNADRRSMAYTRGHMLGGSSSINDMFYTRGSSSDFDRFARVTGDSGWSWNKLQPYIRKNEQLAAPADHHNTTGQFDPSAHGFNGINSVSVSPYPQDGIASRVLQTTKDLANEFPFVLDMNAGDPLGVGWLQTTIKTGVRSSSATSYLGSSFRNRPNLHILLNSRVTRLLPVKGKKKFAFQTVELSSGSTGGSLKQFTASKEVILSAGAIGTPQILQLSGIGDSADLSAVGIKTLVSLPSVGKNLSDQPFINVTWAIASTDPVDNLFTNATFFNEALAEWNRTHSGPLGAGAATHIAWTRLPNNSSIFKTTADPSSGLKSPHLEIFIAPETSFGPPTGHFIGAGIYVLTPVSRGTIKLASANPFDAPLIDPAYLQAQFDIVALREGLKASRRFFAAPAWKGYVLEQAGGQVGANTDDEIDAFLRSVTVPGGHAVGTAAMSPKGAKYGVVDPDLLVKGVSGLRVVDASIMPFVTAGHTQAPVYILAERAADLIKAAWR